MQADFVHFLIHWGIMSFSLWVASHLFKGLNFDSKSSLLISALVLGFANAILRPILFFLTLPLTILTLGLFYLVLNALIIQMVAALVNGFKLKGFWTAFFVSIFIAILGAALELFFPGQTTVLVPSGPVITT